MVPPKCLISTSILSRTTYSYYFGFYLFLLFRILPIHSLTHVHISALMEFLCGFLYTVVEVEEAEPVEEEPEVVEEVVEVVVVRRVVDVVVVVLVVVAGVVVVVVDVDVVVSPSTVDDVESGRVVVVVVEVEPGGAGDVVGIREGDIIVKVRNRDINRLVDFHSQLNMKKKTRFNFNHVFIYIFYH